MKERELTGIKTGVVMTGSHCTMDSALRQVIRLKEAGAIIHPIFSYSVDMADNRFYQAEELRRFLNGVTDQPIINSITGAEPIGPGRWLDLVVVMPATGNTIAKLANGIIDSPALMAVKAHLRNQRPVVIAISTNDALGLNARNLGTLLNTKNIYFVPFRQDDPFQKSNSLTANLDQVVDTAVCALQGRQIQPLILGTL